MLEKPRIDRDRVLREERFQQQADDCFDTIKGLLGERETLGGPVRRGDQIVIPILQQPEAAPRRQPSAPEQPFP